MWSPRRSRANLNPYVPYVQRKRAGTVTLGSLFMASMPELTAAPYYGVGASSLAETVWLGLYVADLTSA